MKSLLVDYGAYGDGVHDDTGPLQAAINAGGEFYIDSGNYLITNTLIINNPISIKGPNQRANFISGGSGFYFFSIQSSDVSISNLSFFGNGNISSAFHFVTYSTAMDRISISNIRGWQMYHGFIDDQSINKTTSVKLKDILFQQHKGYGVSFSSAFAFFFCENVVFDCVGINHSLPLFTIVGNQGCYLDKVFLLGNSQSNYGQNGYSFYSCNAVHLNECHVDTLGGTGYTFSSCSYVQASHLTASLINTHGLYISGTTKSIFNNILCHGRKGLDAQAGCQGIYLTAGNDRISLSGYVSENFSGINFYNNPSNTNILLTGGIIA